MRKIGRDHFGGAEHARVQDQRQVFAERSGFGFGSDHDNWGKEASRIDNWEKEASQKRYKAPKRLKN